MRFITHFAVHFSGAFGGAIISRRGNRGLPRERIGYTTQSISGFLTGIAAQDSRISHDVAAPVLSYCDA
jgi:hypothetical protein